MSNVFSDWDNVSFSRIGEVITMAFRVSDDIRERNGWIEPLGQVLNRSDYPLLYESMLGCPDNEIKKLIINDTSFKAPDWTSRYLRNHGVANAENNGGGGG